MSIVGLGIRKYSLPGGSDFSIFILSHPAASGGAKLVDDQKVVFNNYYAIQVFEFLKTIYDKKYFSRELLSARQDVFLNGIIATRFTGPWEIIRAEKFKKLILTIISVLCRCRIIIQAQYIRMVILRISLFLIPAKIQKVHGNL